MNIVGMDKARVLVALFNGAAGLIAPMAILTGVANGGLTIEQAREVLAQSNYVDYLKGRPIKVDLSKGFLNLQLYDRDHGPGAGEAAILEEFTRPE